MKEQLANRHRVEEFIEAEKETLRYYLSCSGLATASELDEAAHDFFQGGGSH